MSRIIQCPRGHFYDADVYAACPHCANSAAAGETIPMNDETVSMDSGLAPAQPIVPDVPSQGVIDNFKGFTAGGAQDDDDRTISVDMLNSSISYEPVVGWLVCIKGKEYGKSFELKSNKNYIGRSPDSDIALSGDVSVSRHRHAIIIFDSVSNVFIGLPGEAKELWYLNNKVVLTSQELKAGDILTIGATRLLFVPLCGEGFSWKDQESKNEAEDRKN